MSNSNLVVPMLVLGLVAGVLSGLFGIGGGLVIVPALIIAFGFSTKVATGTSLFALIWPVGFFGVLEYRRRGELQILPGLLIAAGMFVGAYFGARITGALSHVTMKRLYGSFLLVVGIYFLYSSRSGAPADPLPLPEPPAVDRLPADGPAPIQLQRPPDLS